MSGSQPHQMRLRTTFPSGAEEWDCPTCGRRFVMQWSPKYKRIVLEQGDAHAAHSATKGSLKINPVTIHYSDERTSADDELPLEHWQTWFDSDELDRWWPED